MTVITVTRKSNEFPVRIEGGYTGERSMGLRGLYRHYKLPLVLPSHRYDKQVLITTALPQLIYMGGRGASHRDHKTRYAGLPLVSSDGAIPRHAARFPGVPPG